MVASLFATPPQRHIWVGGLPCYLCEFECLRSQGWELESWFLVGEKIGGWSEHPLLRKYMFLGGCTPFWGLSLRYSAWDHEGELELVFF